MSSKLDWRFQVRRRRLDSQGYDESGSYWGVGQKLWEVERAGNQNTGLGNGFSYTIHIRARSLKEAISKVIADDHRYRYVRNVF